MPTACILEFENNINKECKRSGAQKPCCKLPTCSKLVMNLSNVNYT